MGTSPAAALLRDKIGTKSPPVTVKIEQGLISRFTEAIEDNNPLWRDEAFARGSRYDGITMPPHLFCSIMLSGSGTQMDLPLPYSRKLDGTGEWDFILTVRPGDSITSVTEFVDLREREGKSGKMLLLSFESTHTNQRNEVVARSRTMMINLE